MSTTYSSIVGRAAAIAARDCGAASVYVQHGVFPDCDFFTYFCHDHLLLWGEANRRTMLRNGIPEAQINVVGATIYDELIHRVRARESTRFPRPGEPVHIAYFASRSGGLAVNLATARRCLATVVDAVAQVPNGRLTVKIHPGDKTGMVETQVRECPGVTVQRDGDAQDLIVKCDAAIVVSSTTGLEVCVAGKPLFVLQVPGVPDAGPYEQFGAAWHINVDSPLASQMLADAIQSLSSDPARAAALADGRGRLIDDVLNGGAGNAVELTAQAISQFVDRPATRSPELHPAR